MSNIGENLIAAGIYSAIFLLYYILKDKKDKDSQKKLEDNLKEIIINENKANSYFGFYICPPITSYIDFENGIITKDSFMLHQNIHNFSLSLQKDLQEKTGLNVYYGGCSLKEDYEKSQFNKDIRKVQKNRMKALRTTNCLILIMPFDKLKTNGIFEAGIAAGRKIKSLYLVEKKEYLPPIMIEGKLENTIDVLEYNNPKKIDLERDICKFMLKKEHEKEDVTDKFVSDIINNNTIVKTL